MADTTDSTTTNEPSAGDLRKMLADEQEKNRKAAEQLATYQQDEQLREAGLGHLTKRQRRTLLRDMNEEGTEFTADAAKEIAKEYGWPTEPEQPKPPTGEGNGQQQGDGQQQEQVVVSENGNLAEDALSALALMQQARGHSASTQVRGDFEQRMKAAKSKEELRDLIRTEGPRHGIIHEWDVP